MMHYHLLHSKLFTSKIPKKKHKNIKIQKSQCTKYIYCYVHFLFGKNIYTRSIFHGGIGFILRILIYVKNCEGNSARSACTTEISPSATQHNTTHSLKPSHQAKKTNLLTRLNSRTKQKLTLHVS